MSRRKTTAAKAERPRRNRASAAQEAPLRGRSLVLVPLQPHRGVPLRIAEVVEQRVEPGGLRVVGHGPVRYRDTGRPAHQTPLEHPGTQHRVEIQTPLGVQQRHARELMNVPGAVEQILRYLENKGFLNVTDPGL